MTFLKIMARGSSKFLVIAALGAILVGSISAFAYCIVEFHTITMAATILLIIYLAGKE